MLFHPQFKICILVGTPTSPVELLLGEGSLYLYSTESLFVQGSYYILVQGRSVDSRRKMDGALDLLLPEQTICNLRIVVCHPHNYHDDHDADHDYCDGDFDNLDDLDDHDDFNDDHDDLDDDHDDHGRVDNPHGSGGFGRSHED